MSAAMLQKIDAVAATFPGLGPAPSPLVLTKSELLRESHALITRVAHSNLPARDAMLVAELVVRFSRLP